MGNITSMVVLYVGSCKFHRNYVSVSSIIYISFFNHIYVSFCKLPYVFCKDIDKKRNYRLLFYILDRFKLILLNVCYIKLLFRFSAAHLWHNMFAIKHVWMQTCLIANTFVPVGRNLSQLAEWNARCSSHHGDVFIGKVGREYGLVHTQPVGLGSIWSYPDARQGFFVVGTNQVDAFYLVGVKLLHDPKKSSKRSEFLRFNLYLCHVI